MSDLSPQIEDSWQPADHKPHPRASKEIYEAMRAGVGRSEAVAFNNGATDNLPVCFVDAEKPHSSVEEQIQQSQSQTERAHSQKTRPNGSIMDFNERNELFKVTMPAKNGSPERSITASKTEDGHTQYIVNEAAYKIGTTDIPAKKVTFINTENNK
jgi:hypothetical protein